MAEDKNFHPADTNGDGLVDAEEHRMYLEFKRKRLEDEDAMRDAQRQMTWYALFGMLLYPFAVVIADVINLDGASKILGDMAATYFVQLRQSLWHSLVKQHTKIKQIIQRKNKTSSLL